MADYTGFTSKTPLNLALDSGAVFVNYDTTADTFATAVAAGKLLGATRGGNTFAAIPTIRRIEVDGVKGAAKGLQVLDDWEVNLTVNVLEVKQETIAKALAATTVDTSGAIYDEIIANNDIVLGDYIDNITWVGRISGTEEPVIIQVFNAMNTQGLTLATTDNAEAVIQMTFRGHYAADALDTPPFKVLYPKPQGTATGTVTDNKKLEAGVTVTLTAGTKAITDTTDADGAYLLVGIPQGTYTITATKSALTGTATGVVIVGGDNTEVPAIAIA